VATSYPDSLDAFTGTTLPTTSTAAEVGGRTHSKRHDDVEDAVEAIQAHTAPVFRPEAYGAVRDGSTDDYAAIMAAITAAYDAGGGIVEFSRGTYKSGTAITMPDTGHATRPQTVPITLRGVGPQWTGRNSVTTTGGSVLDITGTDTYGKVKTKGAGWLGIFGITFTDTAGTTTPFLYTTNTTLHVEGCAFIGSKTGTACDQDAIICGGTNPHETTGGPTAGGAWNDGFQGYATRIIGNYFNHVRRAVHGRTYFNGNIIRDNTIWLQSGNVAGAAIELNGAAASGTDMAAGNTISGNLIEVGSYVYGIDLEYATQNSLIGNHFYDPTGTTLYGIRLRANAQSNFVIDGLNQRGITDLGPTAYPNLILTSAQGRTSAVGPLNIPDLNYDTIIKRLKVTGSGATAFTIQPDTATPDAGNLILVKRSAAEGTNPSANILELRQRADIVMRGAQAGNITFQDAAGTDFTTFTGAGRNWNAAGTGGAMKIDSGTGGSYLTLQNYGLKLVLQDGTGTVTIKQGSGTPEGALAANVGSLYLRTDGGAGTTLYIKESGTGNTGWVAK